jgi:hypothetical protein
MIENVAVVASRVRTQYQKHFSLIEATTLGVCKTCISRDNRDMFTAGNGTATRSSRKPRRGHNAMFAQKAMKRLGDRNGRPPSQSGDTKFCQMISVIQQEITDGPSSL